MVPSSLKAISIKKCSKCHCKHPEPRNRRCVKMATNLPKGEDLASTDSGPSLTQASSVTLSPNDMSQNVILETVNHVEVEEGATQVPN